MSLLEQDARLAVIATAETTTAKFLVRKLRPLMSEELTMAAGCYFPFK